MDRLGLEELHCAVRLDPLERAGRTGFRVLGCKPGEAMDFITLGCPPFGGSVSALIEAFLNLRAGG